MLSATRAIAAVLPAARPSSLSPQRSSGTTRDYFGPLSIIDAAIVTAHPDVDYARVVWALPGWLNFRGVRRHLRQAHACT